VLLIFSTGVGLSVETAIWRRHYVWPWSFVVQSFNFFFNIF